MSDEIQSTQVGEYEKGYHLGYRNGLQFAREEMAAELFELAAQREKTALFDVLSDRVLAANWHVGPGSIGCVLIDVMTTGERIHGATLAEAIMAAMEAEGAR